MKGSILKRAIIYIMVLALIFSNIDMSKIENVSAAETTTDNLMPNGYFEEGLEYWSPYFNNSYAGTAGLTSDYFMEYNISFFLNWYGDDGKDNGPVSWCIMLENKSVEVKAGKKYKIKFKANSSVERPIIVELSVPGAYGTTTRQMSSFVLGNEMREYTIEYTSNYNETVTLKYHLGSISGDTNGNTTGLSITKDDVSAFPHTVKIGKVSMVDITSGDVSFVKTPGIIGVENGASYKTPVSANINYEGNYTYSLTKDGNPLDYKLGDTIVDDGEYIFTATDASNANLKTVCSFKIKKEIDYARDYYTIVSKATDKVIEAVGTKDGGYVVQKSFNGSMGQFFTLNNTSGGYYRITSLMSGKVITVDNNGKLVQSTYTGAANQQWKTVNVPQGFVKIESKSNSGMVIDIPGANKTDNLQLQVFNNNGNGDEGQDSQDAQRFDFVKINNIKEYVEGKKVNVSTKSEWQQNAFITPICDDLNPAGPIAVEWYKAPGDVVSYDIYFNGELKKTVEATEDETLKVEDESIYTTKVAKHQIKIVAKYKDNSILESKINEFFVTKKGVGWGTLHRTTDMNLSWYYRWSTDPAIGTDDTINFVPMLWGNYGDEWLANPENKKYGTILSFNEPDWSDQSNVPVTKELAKAWVDRYNAKYGLNDAPPKSVEEAWQSFMDSGLRVGSPATALAPPYCLGQITMNDVDGPDSWWKDFEQLLKDNEDKDWHYDFVAIHSYNGEGSVEGFLRMLEETYQMTGKPIWITEFGVADWSRAYWNKDVKDSNLKVIEFMEKLLPELDKLEYVERYAWFPFDPNDAYGGSSGLFNYNTGELNTLGMVYANAGLPEGYKPAVDYTAAIEAGKKALKGEKETDKVEEPTTKKEDPTTTKNNTVNVKKPAKVKVKKITCKRKIVKIKIKKVSKVKGYEVRWSTSKKFKKYKKTFIKKNKTTMQIKKFKKKQIGKKYYFKVRAYKVVNGKKIYGKFSKVKKVYIK